jgi:hypothetical protein
VLLFTYKLTINNLKDFDLISVQIIKIILRAREWQLEALQIFATELYERHFNTDYMVTFYFPS